MKRRPRVLVAGSANLDIVVPVDRIPKPGETVLGGDRVEHWGGKGANQAIAARMAGADVRFVSATGRDAPGKAYRKYMASRGIQKRGFFILPAPTGAAFILVDKGGGNQIAVSPGANARLTARLLSGRPGVLEYGDAVLAQLEIPVSAVEAAFRAARRRGATTILNPAPAPASLSRRLIFLADILVPNESEAAALAGRRRGESEAGVLRICRRLHEIGANTVILTAGKRGALVYGEGERGWVRPPPGIRAVDTTGAGDAFSGALAASLAGGAVLIDAVRFAVAAGTLSIRKNGAQAGISGARKIHEAAKKTMFEAV